MVERSLQTSQDGIALAKSALIGRRLTQKALADALGITRQPISKFFNGKAIDRDIFVRICEYLGLDWQAITVRTEAEPKANTEEIDRLVHEVREGIRSLIKERCGTMRVLDMTQPIQLTGEGGIYTNVNILEKITGRRRLELAQLFENVDLEEFDRFGLSAVKEKRIPGIKAVSKHRKLMVLGKPGAGKTTFLKYLAMNCIEGNFLADHVPIFITLKDFVEFDQCPDLLTYIETQIAKNDAIQEIIRQGRSFLLLDGLDEVREEDIKRILHTIQSVSNDFPDNHFVITCRIAAEEYVFAQFTEVEVADFDKKQIEIFIHNWFRCKKPGKSKSFANRILSELDKNKSIKELASNPLLLTLLCLEWEESEEFPKNRADLYERDLKVLLRKWDASRKIERFQIYKKLSLNRKEELLGQLARKTFEQKNTFFKQRMIEHYIADYIINLPDAQNDSKALQLNSELVLKSIEAQHGLLVERAKGIYSFSHLTFQEYFTAKDIVRNSHYDELVKYLTDKRWREVFLLIVDITLEADHMLTLMKQKLDDLGTSNKAVQRCLSLVYSKIPSLDSLLELTEFRDCDRTEAAFWLPVVRSLCLDCSIEYIHNIYLAFSVEAILDNINSFYDLFCLSEELMFYKSFELAMLLESDIGEATSSELETLASFELACQLNKLLEPIKDPMKYINFTSLEKEFYQVRQEMASWWTLNGNDWKEKLRNFVVEYRRYLKDLEFNQQELVELRNYYNTSKLLVECLNSDCDVSHSIRHEIEETFLLPMAKIEKRKAK